MKQPKSIAIIGAGPAGLMAAEVLGEAGHSVTVYDRMASPGRKFLMAGRGGLNLTHSEKLDDFMSRYGAAADWLSPSIHAFPPEALRAWCEGLGVETFIGSSGRVFPRSMKAAPLLRAWLRRLEKLGVHYSPHYHWQGIDDAGLVFLDNKGQCAHVKPDATLLALGGASWPRLGSDGGWAKILSQWNIPLAPLQPANCGFIVPWSEYFSTRFAGQPLKSVMLTHNGISHQGDAMITKAGLEGGAVYALSSVLRDAIDTHGKAEITIDLRPDMALEALAQKFEAPRGSKSLSNYLQNMRFSPLAISLLRETTTSEALSRLGADALAARLKALPVTFTAPTDIAGAISTAGGIRQDAVDSHFMLRNKPGIFAAGEMLDWEAPTGGYLLQACFSTAVAAAKGMQHFLEK
jgi:uncharacterized flavoprotein (TIGR03862 family)